MLELADGGALWGPNVEIPGYRRLYGGQLLAQALVAAGRGRDAGTGAGTGKAPRSVHMVFVAEARPGELLRWTVEHLHDGRSFATRTVRCEQAGRLVAVALVSQHSGEAGFEHQLPAPAVEPPESLEATEAIGPAGAMPFEMRVAGAARRDEPAIGVVSAPPSWAVDAARGAEHKPEPEPEPEHEHELAVWMRPVRPFGTWEPLVHEAALAWCSDATMMSAALRPHGVEPGSPALAATAVTTHTVSFHRPFSFDGWMLFAQQSPCAAAGRAYARGDWFTTEGALVASCAQEMLVRPASG